MKRKNNGVFCVYLCVPVQIPAHVSVLACICVCTCMGSSVVWSSDQQVLCYLQFCPFLCCLISHPVALSSPCSHKWSQLYISDSQGWGDIGTKRTPFPLSRNPKCPHWKRGQTTFNLDLTSVRKRLSHSKCHLFRLQMQSRNMEKNFYFLKREAFDCILSSFTAIA